MTDEIRNEQELEDEMIMDHVDDPEAKESKFKKLANKAKTVCKKAGKGVAVTVATGAAAAAVGAIVCKIVGLDIFVINKDHLQANVINNASDITETVTETVKDITEN